MAEPALRLPVLDTPPDGAPVTGESFREPPNLAVAGTDPELQARYGWKDGKPPEAAPAPAPEPTPAPAAAPAWDPSQFAQAIAYGNMQAQAARDAQAAQERAAQEYQQRIAQALTPPPLPTGEAADRLIADPEALKAAFAARDQWFRNGLATFAEAINAQNQQAMAAMAQQLYQPITQMRAEGAMNSAQDRLYAMGFDNPAELLGELETRLRSGDPAAYWNVVTNPDSLTIGAQFVAQQRGMVPNSNVTGPVSVGYTPANPTQSRPSSYVDPVLQRVEQAFGRKLPRTSAALAQQVEDGGIR